MSDISKILEENSVRDLQEAEDRRFMEHLDEALGAFHPPFLKWHEFDGVVHMTGVWKRTIVYKQEDRRTLCQIMLDPGLPNFPTEDHPGSVTCLSCLSA